MLDYLIRQTEGIMVLLPHPPLSKADFDGLCAAANAYLANHAKLRGLLIQSKDFPGWENFAAFSAHMHFVHDHHARVDRVAIVTDSHRGGLAESRSAHLTVTEIKHCPLADEARALVWLETAIR